VKDSPVQVCPVQTDEASEDYVQVWMLESVLWRSLKRCCLPWCLL